MSEYPQNRFRRLVLVGPSDNKRQRFSPGPRPWGQPRSSPTNQKTQPSREQFKAFRMAVMPTLSRGMWLEAMSSLARFVRSYFVGRPKQRGAVILSFDRAGLRRSWREEGFVTKKASGSVCWNSDQTPQEEGRG